MNRTVLDRPTGIDELIKAVTGWPRKWILFALSRHDFCEKDLCDLLGFEKSSISQNLTLLRDRGMVIFERDGLRKAFRLSDRVTVVEQALSIELTVSGEPGNSVTVQFVLEPDILAKFDAAAAPAEIEVKRIDHRTALRGTTNGHHCP